jgi:hypothetical protein
VWFLHELNPWQHVAEAFNELLSPARLVLLKSAPDRVHVEAVVFLGCAKDSVVERRRDYRRTPYADAVQENRPIRLDGVRDFLQPVEGEHQYLVALQSQGELLGFCVIGVPARVAAEDSFLSDLGRLADEMAILLHRRRELDTNRTTAGSGVHAEGIDATLAGSVRQIAEAMRVAVGKRVRVEDIYQEGAAASMFFDVYGNQIMANQAFQALLDQESIGTEQPSPIALLGLLTDVDEATLRREVRQALVTGQPVRYPVVLPQTKHRYFVRYQSVKAKLLGAFDEDVYPFQALGLRVDLLASEVATEMDWLQPHSDLTTVAETT